MVQRSKTYDAADSQVHESSGKVLKSILKCSGKHLRKGKGKRGLVYLLERNRNKKLAKQKMRSRDEQEEKIIFSSISYDCLNKFISPADIVKIIHLERFCLSLYNWTVPITLNLEGTHHLSSLGFTPLICFLLSIGFLYC